jgi:hypothetical protein
MLLCGMQVVRAELVETLVAAAAEAAVDTVRLFGCWRGQKVSPGGLVAWGFEFSLEVVLLRLFQCPHRARLPRGEHLVQGEDGTNESSSEKFNGNISGAVTIGQSSNR